VISYLFLWPDEAERGEEEGRKIRPCLVMSARPAAFGLRIIVLPITTRRYRTDAQVIIPSRVIAHLRLDDRSIIIADALNRFTWVGPDVRKATGKDDPFIGIVPDTLRVQAQGVLARLIKADRARLVSRTA
jgi:hypothetical protein